MGDIEVCEVCGEKIAMTDLYCPGDGFKLCESCSPLASEQVADFDAALADGLWERDFGDYFEDEADLRAHRDKIAARINEIGDYKLVRRDEL